MYLYAHRPRSEDFAPHAQSRLALVLKARLAGFAAGLFASAIFPLLLMRPGAAQTDCYAHWAYGLGESIALLAVTANGFRPFPLTTAIYATLTLGWIVLVSQNCDLWLILWRAIVLPAAHPGM